MTTPLTWQLEGQDNSLGTTFATMSAEAQKWATTVTGYANQVFEAMKLANGGGTTGAGGLGAVPAQATAAATATKAYAQAQGEAAQQAVLRGSAEEHAYAALMAAQQQADREAQAQMTRAKAENAELLREVEQLATAKREEAAADEMRATQAARAAAAQSGGDTRVGGFISAQGPANDQERLATSIQQVGAAATAAAPKLNAAGTATEDLGRKATTTGDTVDRLGAHLQNLLFNQAFYMGLNAIQQGITDVVNQMVTGVKESETAITTYTQRLGNATEAQARWNAVSKESTQVGIPAKDLIELDTDLAKIGVTSQNAQERFGRSLGQIRGDLEDLAALPDVGINQVEEFFTRGSEGAASLVRTLQTAGVASKAELEAVGIEFAKGSNQIISSGDAVGAALLDLSEKKFPGLAAAQAQTMTGIETRTSNTMERVGAILGRPIFKQFETNANAALTAISSPAWETQLNKIADAISRVETAGQVANIVGAAMLTGQDPAKMLENYNAQVKLAELQSEAAARGSAAFTGALTNEDAAAQQTTAALAGLTTALAQTNLAISDLKAEEAGLTDPLQAQIASVSQYETTVLAQYQETTAGLNQSLSDVRDAATQASADAQTAAAPWQAKLADLATASQDLKAHYDALIQPIKDQETALDRVYQRTQDIARINSAGDKVARDRALAVDIYSSEGRSAATRLPDEIAAQAQAQAEAAHNASKNVLEDRVTGLQREQAAQEANVQAQQRNDQAHITAIQNADKVTQAGYKAQEASIQTQIRDTDQQRAAFQKTQDNIKEDLQLQLDNITAMYNVRLKQYDTEAALIQRNQTLLQLGNAAVMATTLATSDVVLNTIITTVNALHNTALGLIPNLQNPNAGAVPGYTGKPYQNPNAGAVPGRASGGSVDEGWYIVGENGPEPLHAGGPGQVYPNGGAGQTVTFVMEDPRGKQWFRTTWQANRSYIKQDLTSMMRGN